MACMSAAVGGFTTRLVEGSEQKAPESRLCLRCDCCHETVAIYFLDVLSGSGQPEAASRGESPPSKKSRAELSWPRRFRNRFRMAAQEHFATPGVANTRKWRPLTRLVDCLSSRAADRSHGHMRPWHLSPRADPQHFSGPDTCPRPLHHLYSYEQYISSLKPQGTAKAGSFQV